MTPFRITRADRVIGDPGVSVKALRSRPVPKYQSDYATRELRGSCDKQDHRQWVLDFLLTNHAPLASTWSERLPRSATLFSFPAADWAFEHALGQRFPAESPPKGTGAA